MSLATRCTACGTVFRVVQDQLKVSEGWVRCGRCEQVFNALEGLFDLDREAPPPWSGAPLAEPVEDWSSDEPPAGSVPLPSFPYATPAPAGQSLLQREDRGPSTLPIDRLDEADEPESSGGFADARFHSELLADSTVTLAPPTSTLPTVAEEAEAPRFVRQAERAERWRSPGMRVALSVLALLLALLLVGQIARHFRDGLAAHWPQSRAALESLCEWSGCRIEPLRRVDHVVVDSSGLTKLDSGSAYRLAVVLRNRGRADVMLPAIDLSLTDPQGQLIARRVLSAAELGASSTTLAAGTELALQGVINAGERRVVGYTVEIFYP